MIRAEVVADSVSPEGKRITTFKTRYPWFIHGELMTHRVLSRNASSNRAIPLKKMLEEARSDALRAEPVYWGAEQKGMEPGGELLDYPLAPYIKVGEKYMLPKMEAQIAWANAAHEAAHRAEQLGKLGLHKSLCNRLLMPFTHANVVITATEWDNFFGLRLDKAADPTMRALAEAMWVAMNVSQPTRKVSGNWHLPFADDAETADQVEAWLNADNVLKGPVNSYSFETNLYTRVSVARCARVSYESFSTVLPDGTVVPGKRSTVEEDLGLYDRLLAAQPLHASPAEHQATPDDVKNIDVKVGEASEEQKRQRMSPPIDIVGEWCRPEEHGNLVGWRQYRKMLKGESCAPLPEAYR